MPQKVLKFRTRRSANSRMRGTRSMLDKLGGAPDLAMSQACRYPVDVKNYTTQERSAAALAMDYNGASMDALTFTETTGFPGFPTLVMLAQLAEYRTMHEVVADDLTRAWGFIKSTGSTAPDKMEKIEAELLRIDAKAIVRQSVIHNEAYGGSHVFFKFKDDTGKRELPIVMRPFSVPENSFEGLRVVEPYWVTPNNYNSIDPTAADFYKPSTWWMLGVQVHASRMQTIVPRPVGDMLKPTYSFRGLSMTQLAMPYVDNWLRTRQSVSDTVKQFSITGVLTDLQAQLTPGAESDLVNRAELFNRMRDNRNIAFLDKTTEEFFQINTPLSGLDALQAQSQEQMSAISRIPLVKLLGITPTGLNASSEGEIRVYYDYVKGYQTNCYSPLMATILRVIQLSLFGEIDDSVTWEWAPLQELTALENAERQKIQAETAAVLIEATVVTPEIVAEVLNNDSTSDYAGAIIPETIDDIPDDDIHALTQALVEMQPVPEPDITAEPEEQSGSPVQPGEMAVSQSTPGTGGAVSEAAARQIQQTGTSTQTGDPSASAMTDPSPEVDPGSLEDPARVTSGQGTYRG